MTRQKKIYIGLAGFTGFLLILLLVFHFLGSPYVNSEGMRKKIQTIISQKTGGEVEYETIDLSLLPYTHAVIHQARISIPGKVEGTVKTLKIIPKIFPLFIGKLLIEIQIESPDFKIAITLHPEDVNEAKEPFNLDTFKGTVAGALSPLAAEIPEFHITIKDGGFNLIEEEETFFTFSDVQAEIGWLSKEIEIKMNGTSNLCEDISVIASFGQKDLKGKGEIELKQFQPQSLINRFLPDAAYQISKPINKMSVYLKADGPNDSGISFVSNLSLQDGPRISLDMFLNPDGMEINKFLIQDAESNASFVFALNEKEIDFDFTGNLSHTTTDKIFLNTPFSKGWIKGDFQAHILLDQLKHSTFQGILEGKNLSFPWIQKLPLSINDITLRADNKSVRVDPLKLTWEDNHLSVNGDVNISENGFSFDLDMSADGLSWDTIRKTLEIGDKEQDKNVGEEKQFWDIPVKGILRVDAESFTFDQYTWNPVQANISFDPDYISVQVTDANLCGISCPGVLKVTTQDISLDFQLLSHNQELGTTIKCFGAKKGLITGKFDFQAQVMARGASEELGKSLNGNFEITARDGQYNRFGLLSKILSFLNPTEIFRGKLPGVTKEGFPYKSIAANGHIQNGILMIDKYALDAPSVGVNGHGTVDLFAKKLDIEILVSPFNTADFVVKKIPIIRGLLGGTIVSIPVEVKGDIENPKISYLSPSSVGKKLLNTTKRALEEPVKIIKPIIPGKKKSGSNSVK